MNLFRQRNTISRIEREDRITSLRRLPWYSITPPRDVSSGVGMIGIDERRMLYTLTKDYYDGEGQIIDGGTYLGSSSLALALGLADRKFPHSKVIDAFDIFTIDEGSIQHHMDMNDPITKEVKPGDHVRYIYERNLSEFLPYIEIHDGDLLAQKWSGKPISILFSDICKGPSLQDYILKNWFTNLVPKKGILIQQDQVQQYHVWVSVVMSMLEDYFETIDYTVNSSMVYRLKKQIPGKIIDRCQSKNISHDDMVEHYTHSLNRFRRVGMGRFAGWHLGMLELGLAVLYGFHIGDKERGLHVLRDVKDRYFDVPDTMQRARLIEEDFARGWCPGGTVNPK